jgi:hypothetical protein
MRVCAYPFWLPKAGNMEEEYEDAFWPPSSKEEGGAKFSFAVADGATEASYSKIWANLLVEAYCAGALEEESREASIAELQAKWREVVTAQPLPWYAEEKIRSGAFSSLLGLTLHDTKTPRSTPGTWEALAVGDSCLFQMRDGEMIERFPITSSEEFNNRPALLSSNPGANERLAQYTFSKQGKWEAGDVFYLTTDALACSLLKAAEEGDKPWLIKRPTQEDFVSWISRLREKGSIGNDDVTMVSVEPLLDGPP